MADQHQNEFLDAAGRSSNGGLLGNVLGFIVENAKWWLIPFVVVFGLLAVVLVAGQSSAGAFLYSFF